MSTRDNDALYAALHLIERTGAKRVEIGYLNEDVPEHLADWYAHAAYHGARVTAEHHCGPVEAAEALARKLLEGGTCAFCGLCISLSDRSDKRCRWTRQGDRWIRGCQATHRERNPKIVAAARKQVRGESS